MGHRPGRPTVHSCAEDLSRWTSSQGYAPWHLGFSYGRALQHSCLQHWGGRDLAAGQASLLARARANGAASRGVYKPGSEPSDDTSLFVANYSY